MANPTLAQALAVLLQAVEHLRDTPPTLPMAPPMAAERWPVEEQRHARRLDAATRAVALAQQLLAESDPSESIAIQAALDDLARAVANWRSMSSGWYEDRVIRRKPKPGIVEAGDHQADSAERSFGPYRYYHYYEDGKKRSRYLGPVAALAAAASAADNHVPMVTPAAAVQESTDAPAWTTDPSAPEEPPSPSDTASGSSAPDGFAKQRVRGQSAAEVEARIEALRAAYQGQVITSAPIQRAPDQWIAYVFLLPQEEISATVPAAAEPELEPARATAEHETEAIPPLLACDQPQTAAPAPAASALTQQQEIAKPGERSTPMVVGPPQSPPLILLDDDTLRAIALRRELNTQLNALVRFKQVSRRRGFTLLELLWEALPLDRHSLAWQRPWRTALGGGARTYYCHRWGD